MFFLCQRNFGLSIMKNEYKIILFDTKPYDQEFFDRINKDYGFEIKYFKGHLNCDTAEFSRGYDVVCGFVNDIIDKKVINILKSYNVKLVALRCAGYNNVDLKAAYKNIHHTRLLNTLLPLC